MDVEDGPDGLTLVRVRGELDLATTPEFETALQGTRADARIVIDLSGCEFLDSSGLRALLVGAARSEAEGGSVELVAPDSRIRRVLELAHAGEKLRIHHSHDAVI